MQCDTQDDTKSDTLKVPKKISVAMKNVNNLMETCCQYKEDKCCCIIPKDLHQHRMKESDFIET